MVNHEYIPFRTPDEDDIDILGEALGVDLTTSEVSDYTKLVSSATEGVSAIRGIDPIGTALQPDAGSKRGQGYRPGTDEDPHNAWLVKTTIEPTGEGPLSGTTVGLKDSIALAGYPMTAGSSVLDGFVPRIDAPIVTRLLEAGATITGKLNMESFAWSGRGDLSDFGPVLNPHNPAHLAGGSSSGSGAAPANGECDVSIGTDQAGSIRIPSSWCGLVGIKPTHGLVPYTGILPLEHSIDHVGPMGQSVDIVARTLSAIAGECTIDGIPVDDRQPRGIGTPSYVDAVTSPVDECAIAVLEEGFGWPASDPAVDEAVEQGIAQLSAHVGAVDRVSLPLHRSAPSIWAPIATSGGIQTLMNGGVGLNTRSWAWPRLASTLQAFLESRSHGLPPSVKRTMLAAAYIEQEYGIEAYAKARDGAIRARHEYDTLLDRYDALVLPTTIVRAFAHSPDRNRIQMLGEEINTILNTCMLNVTGHPAISVPCGTDDGLPIGIMFVGSHFDESTLFALAGCFEDAYAPDSG